MERAGKDFEWDSRLLQNLWDTVRYEVEGVVRSRDEVVERESRE